MTALGLSEWFKEAVLYLLLLDTLECSVLLCGSARGGDTSRTLAPSLTCPEVVVRGFLLLDRTGVSLSDTYGTDCYLPLTLLATYPVFAESAVTP